MTVYTFEFIPNDWQASWPDDADKANFVVEYTPHEGDSSVGEQPYYEAYVSLNGMDITDMLSEANIKQLDEDVAKHYNDLCNEDYGDHVSEAQEWHDFDPDC